MTPYVILIPGDVLVGYIRSDGKPSLEACADQLARDTGFEDRDAMLEVNAGMIIGFAPLH